MMIRMKQVELEVAVRDYVRKMGVGREISKIDFVASRSSDGTLTEITLSDEAVPQLSNSQEAGAQTYAEHPAETASLTQVETPADEDEDDTAPAKAPERLFSKHA